LKYLVLAVLLFSMVSCASNVERIGNYSNPQKVLLVIDMQIDYIDENGKLPIEICQINNLVTSVNNIIDDFDKNNNKIIYLRRIFSKNDFRNRSNNYAVVEGTSGLEIDPRIKIISNFIFDKYAPSSFTNSDFENFLIENQINELHLCGVMADECVYETALDAFNKGYIVNYYANAVGSSKIKNIEKAIKKLNKKGINIIGGIQ